jgi:hypothetical protein
MNTAPKYSKVELLLKNNTSKQSDGLIPKTEDFPQTTRLEFTDAGLIITGDYAIVVEDEVHPEHSLTSTGRIFHLSQIAGYRTYKS